MASKPWSEEEVQVLEQHASDPRWFRKVAPSFPDRTPKALRCRMTMVREGLDMPAPIAWGRTSDNGWQRKAREASMQLAEATLRVGRWS